MFETLSLAVIDKTGNPSSKKTHVDSVNTEETPEKEIKPKERTYSLKKFNYLDLRLASFLPYAHEFQQFNVVTHDALV